MPITEVVRVLAEAEGRVDGRPVLVGLSYDVDGRHGADADAIGYPAFWLRCEGAVLGPFPSEGEAIEAAWQRYGADFDAG
jgi:hypothetical protein